MTACGHEPKVLDFSKVKEAPPDPESVTKAVAVKIGMVCDLPSLVVIVIVSIN